LTDGVEFSYPPWSRYDSNMIKLGEAATSRLCLGSLQQLSRAGLKPPHRRICASFPRRSASTLGLRAHPVPSQQLGAGFFFSKHPRPHNAPAAQHTPAASVTGEASPKPTDRASRRDAAAAISPSSSATDATDLPPDASSILTTVAARQPARSLGRRVSAFLSLAKPRLTVLVVLTAMAPYALYPSPEFLSPTLTETPSLSPLTLFFLTTGTALCSASANSLNMLYELKTDAMMSRTRNRPLVRQLVSRRGAILFAVLTATVGVSALYFGVNPTVSFLGAANIAIYAGMYTPLKAMTAANTWVGAVVGGIPPLMGWAAAAGENATDDGTWHELLFSPDGGSIGGWLLAGLLFAWQFPHFMALSWPVREEYRAAGLRMLAWTNPARNARVALRYCLVFIPLCLALSAAGVTEWSFAVTSLPVNGWLAWQAVRFWKHQGHKGTARGLFWASVWHLPGVMALALVQKKGMWTRVWRSIVGEEKWDDELPEVSGSSMAEKKSVSIV